MLKQQIHVAFVTHFNLISETILIAMARRLVEHDFAVNILLLKLKVRRRRSISRFL